MTIETIHTNEIIKELPTDGHSPLLVIGSDYKMYVAKNDKGKVPPVALINECLASYFLKQWQIEVPDSKLIWVSKDIVKSKPKLSINHKLHYYDLPCFGSKFIDDSVEVNSIFLSKKKKFYNRLINPHDIFHITLFDTWVENDDRKPTNYNLIFKPKNGKLSIIPIDNAYIFSTMSYKDLNPNHGVAVSSNEHLLVSELGYLIKKQITVNEDFIKREREYFYICIENCKHGYQKYIKQVAKHYPIEPNLISKLETFLFDEVRNNKVFEEYVYRLSQ